MEKGYCGSCRDGVLKPVQQFESPLEFVTEAGAADGLTTEDVVEYSICQECIDRARELTDDTPGGYPLVVEATYNQMMIDGNGRFIPTQKVKTLFNLRFGNPVTQDRA